MKILITGGAGYLGSILTMTLLAHKHSVTVVDTFEHSQPSLAAWAFMPELTIVKLDCRVMHVFGNKFWSQFDVVVPLAAVVGQAACEARPYEAKDVNLSAISTMMGLLSDEQTVIFPCTNSGYGIGTDSMCTEESPLQPLSIYGKTKVEAEEAIMERENSVSLRLATLFGWSPRMRRDLLVNDLTWRAVNDHSAVIFEGHARRNFCHVRDAALAFVHVIKNFSTMRGQIYNVGDTRANMTKVELCNLIKKYTPFHYVEQGYSVDPDKRDYLVSNDKIERTGWRPIHTLENGIKELINGYQMLKKEQYGNV